MKKMICLLVLASSGMAAADEVWDTCFARVEPYSAKCGRQCERKSKSEPEKEGCYKWCEDKTKEIVNRCVARAKN